MSFKVDPSGRKPKPTPAPQKTSPVKASWGKTELRIPDLMRIKAEQYRATRVAAGSGEAASLTRPTVARKIMIVDDNTLIAQRFIAAFQERSEFAGPLEHVDPRTAKEVVDIVMQEDFDLVIIDGDLQGELRGEEVVQALRAAGFNGYIVANSSDREMNAAMLAKGADHDITGKDPTYLPRFFLMCS